jgi:hypothetical protein
MHLYLFYLRFTSNICDEFCKETKRTYDSSVIGQKGRHAPLTNARGAIEHSSEYYFNLFYS